VQGGPWPLPCVASELYRQNSWTCKSQPLDVHIPMVFRAMFGSIPTENKTVTTQQQVAARVVIGRVAAGVVFLQAFGHQTDLNPGRHTFNPGRHGLCTSAVSLIYKGNDKSTLECKRLPSIAAWFKSSHL
jgi:hypothetical protein